MGRIRNIAAAAACAGLMLAPAAASAQTTPADRNTKVTFSGPVSIPGKTLPAGTYTFRIADSPTNRHIVQVFDKDETQIIATLLAVPAEKMEAEGDPVITFKETPADRPPALHYWYYAGEKTGNEFVYPRSQAMAIAQASGEGVMAVDTDSTNIDDWKGTPTRVTATGQNPASSTTSSSTTSSDTTSPQAQPQPQSTPPTTAQPTTTPEPAPQSAAPATTPQSQPTTAPTTAPQSSAPTTAPSAPAEPERPVGTSGRPASELPHTASSMPLVGLVGLLACAGALAIRARRTGLI